jgi:hypothetical protein
VGSEVQILPGPPDQSPAVLRSIFKDRAGDIVVCDNVFCEMGA